MLKIIKDEYGEVLYTTCKQISVHEIDVKKELERINVDEFVKDFREKQIKREREFKIRYAKAKREVEKKGYIVHDFNFSSEEPFDFCYAGQMGSVLAVEKCGMIIDFWANGESDYEVFDERSFFRSLDFAVESGDLTKEEALKLKKMLILLYSLIIEEVFIWGEGGNPLELIVEYFQEVLNAKEKMFLIKNYDSYFTRYKNEYISPKDMPIAWELGIYDTYNNNWIEVFIDDANGKQINSGDVADSDNFIEELENIDSWWEFIKHQC
jgi:hypothetical protein